MAQVVEDAVVFNEGRIFRTPHGDLVGEAPNDDGRMVVVLGDELLHLGNGVFKTIFKVTGDVRNFRPDDHAVLIAQVVEILVVLIVRKADGRRAELADVFHVLPVMLRQQRVADSPAVLMAGDAAQRVFFAVEDEAALRIDLKRAAAKAGLHAVDDFAVFHKFDRSCV